MLLKAGESSEETGEADEETSISSIDVPDYMAEEPPSEPVNADESEGITDKHDVGINSLETYYDILKRNKVEITILSTYAIWYQNRSTFFSL